VVLGAREVRALTLATCVMDGLGDSYVISSGEFWRFSVTVALLAELLARMDRVINGNAFTVGILHGIGLLALDLYWPDGLQEVLSIDDPQLRRASDRERAVFGFTSAEVGAELALRWRLPRPIVQAIANQGVRLDELERTDRLSRYLVRARIFARFSGLSDGLERSQNHARRPPSGSSHRSQRPCSG
jgi:HD-like signal output (HDOD) protein